MNKKTTTIIVLVIGVILLSLYIISSTYSVIIEVLDKDGKSEIVNEITIRDLVTNDNGTYNSTYYDAINELDITTTEVDTLIDSLPLNRALDVVLKNIVDYKLHGKNKLTNSELYDLIVSAINEDNTISIELKNKVIDKSREYIDDISKFMYDIGINNHGDVAWSILSLR